MQPGVFAKTFARATVEEVFGAVAAHGFTCVQFNFACAGLPSLPEWIGPKLAVSVRQAAVAHNLAIAAVSGTFNMIHPNPEARRDGLRKLRVIAGACQRLGTRVITLCTGTRDPDQMWRRHPENDSVEAWRDLLVTLTEAVVLADQSGVILGIEPETGNVISSARKARRLLDEFQTPRLKIIMDAANLLRPEDLPRMKEILEEAFDLLGSDLILAHAKELDANGRAGGLPPGSGRLDWCLYLELLRRVNFAGPFVMHGCNELAVAEGVAFLRQRGVAF